MNQLPSILTPDLGLLFWMLGAFIVVYLVLARYAMPVIVSAVEKRSEHINDSLKKAEEAAVRLANIHKEGESILQQARQQQAQILKEAAETRDSIIAQAKDKARVEASRMLEDARSEIESEKQAALREIRHEMAELSVKVAEKVLYKELNSDAKQMETIDRLLDEVSVADKIS